MRFIKVWSYSCAYYLTDKLKDTHEKRGVYYYGFQVVIGSLVKLFFLVLLSLVFGSLIPTLAVTGVFISLRILAGGYHMDTYGKCIIISLAIFIFFGTLIQYTHALLPRFVITALLAVTAAYAFYSAYKWAPKDTPNKPITKPCEIKKFRFLTFTHLLLWLPATYTLIYFNYNMFALCSISGVLISIFIITPAGHRFFDKIKDTVLKQS